MSPLPEQLLGAVAVENGARIDLRRHAERDARREVGLDEAGDDVHRRPLRGEQQVDADGAGHLRQACDGLLDLVARHHHQVGEFVDDDDDVGQRLGQRLVRVARAARRRGLPGRCGCTGRCSARPRPPASCSAPPSPGRPSASALAACFGSTTTGVSRCGISSYIPSSRRLGSIMISRTSSGVARKRMLVSIALSATDLPVPVAPAMSRWGIVARSPMNGSPWIVLPSAMRQLRRRRAGRRPTRAVRAARSARGAGSGIWMPTVDLPGDAFDEHRLGPHRQREVVGQAR